MSFTYISSATSGDARSALPDAPVVDDYVPPLPLVRLWRLATRPRRGRPVSEAPSSPMENPRPAHQEVAVLVPADQ